MGKEKPTLWGDMDGVFAVYERHAYTGDDPLFLREGEHYFSTCSPDMAIIKAFEIMAKAVETHVITNLSETAGDIVNEHAEDKRKWVSRHMAFAGKNFHPICRPKADEAMDILKRRLTKTDVLVSDYNPDLIRWEEAGGTGVKYLNTINSPDSWPGVHIPENTQPDGICAILKEYLNIT